MYSTVQKSKFFILCFLDLSNSSAGVLQAFQSFPFNISSFQCSPFNCNGLRGTVAVKKLKEGKEGKPWGEES